MSSLPTSTNDRKQQIEAIHTWLTHLYAVYIDETFFRTKDRAGTVHGANKQEEHVSAHAMQNLIAAMKDKNMQQKFTRLMVTLSSVGMMYDQWFQNNKSTLTPRRETSMEILLDNMNARVSQIFQLIKTDWKHIWNNEMMLDVLKRLNAGSETTAEGRALIERNQMLNEHVMAEMLTILVSAFKFEQNHLPHAAFKRIAGQKASASEGAIIKKSVPALEQVNEQLGSNKGARISVKKTLEYIDNLFFYPYIDPKNLSSSDKPGYRNNNISDYALVSAMHLYLMMEAYENLFATDPKGNPSELWKKLESGFLERRGKEWGLSTEEFKLFQDEFYRNIIMFDVHNSANEANYKNLTAGDAKTASEPIKRRSAALKAMQQNRREVANSPTDPDESESMKDEDYEPSDSDDETDEDEEMHDKADSKNKKEKLHMPDHGDDEDVGTYVSPETRQAHAEWMKTPPPVNPEVADVQRELAEANAKKEEMITMFQQSEQENASLKNQLRDMQEQLEMFRHNQAISDNENKKLRETLAEIEAEKAREARARHHSPSQLNAASASSFSSSKPQGVANASPENLRRHHAPRVNPNAQARPSSSGFFQQQQQQQQQYQQEQQRSQSPFNRRPSSSSLSSSSSASSSSSSPSHSNSAAPIPSGQQQGGSSTMWSYSARLQEQRQRQRYAGAKRGSAEMDEHQNDPLTPNANTVGVTPRPTGFSLNLSGSASPSTPMSDIEDSATHASATLNSATQDDDAQMTPANVGDSKSAADSTVPSNAPNVPNVQNAPNDPNAPNTTGAAKPAKRAKR